jgi:hypothetical protein
MPTLLLEINVAQRALFDTNETLHATPASRADLFPIPQSADSNDGRNWDHSLFFRHGGRP